MDEIHRGILKKFHTLCGVLGLTDDEKHAIVSSYGVESSRDMDTHDLINVCAKLSEQANKKAGHGEVDKLRKRVMASIGAYLRATGRESNATVIKGIACRASGYDDFNKIPKERLRNWGKSGFIPSLQIKFEPTMRIIHKSYETTADDILIKNLPLNFNEKEI